MELCAASELLITDCDCTNPSAPFVCQQSIVVYFALATGWWGDEMKMSSRHPLKLLRNMMAL
jgi:hypothetical protein